MLNKVRRARRTMQVDLGREPSAAELAAELDLTTAKVEQVLRQAREPVSLHARVTEDGAELGDLVADEAPGPAATVAAAALRPSLDRVLATLSDREAAVLTLRFGLDDEQPCTHDEIGACYGLTRERIRQIETKGLTKLRQPARARVLADLLS